MKKRGIQIFIVMAMLLLLVLPAASFVSADVVATNTYDVSGTTLKEVGDSIDANSPNPGGAGYAECKVIAFRTDGQVVSYSQMDDDCPGHLRYTAWITRTITWSIETTITLPAWTGGYSGACAEVQAEWNRFLADLTAHEKGHDQVAKDALTNANPLPTITGTGSDCDLNTAIAIAKADLEAKYSAEGQRVLNAVQTASAQYDADTNHGENQGAVLDESVVCGGCFIATAAYGTPMAPQIQVLRDFRDQYLLTNPAGEALVEFYYQVSPPMAEFITEHPALKPVVRAALVPAVAMSTVAVKTTLVEKIAIVGSMALVSALLVVWFRKRAGKAGGRAN